MDAGRDQAAEVDWYLGCKHLPPCIWGEPGQRAPPQGRELLPSAVGAPSPLRPEREQNQTQT